MNTILPEVEKELPTLDLEVIFLQKINVEAVRIDEFYRKAGVTFRLCKPESRILLKRLIQRGLAKREGQTVTFIKPEETQK